MIVNGTEVQTPYDTDSRVCSDNFTYAWDALRKANRLQVKTTDGQTVDLPVDGAATALPAWPPSPPPNLPAKPGLISDIHGPKVFAFGPDVLLAHQ